MSRNKNSRDQSKTSPQATTPSPSPDRPALIAGLMNQRTEWSKSLFSLSATGLGLAAGTLVTKGAELNAGVSWTLVITATAFLICVLSSAAAFKTSGDYLEAILRGDDPQIASCETRLKSIGSHQERSFFFGIFALLAAAVVFLASPPIAMNNSSTPVKKDSFNLQGLRGVLSTGTPAPAPAPASAPAVPSTAQNSNASAGKSNP